MGKIHCLRIFILIFIFSSLHNSFAQIVEHEFLKLDDYGELIVKDLEEASQTTCKVVLAPDKKNVLVSILKTFVAWQTLGASTILMFQHLNNINIQENTGLFLLLTTLVSISALATAGSTIKLGEEVYDLNYLSNNFYAKLSNKSLHDNKVKLSKLTINDEKSFINSIIKSSSSKKFLGFSLIGSRANQQVTYMNNLFTNIENNIDHSIRKMRAQLHPLLNKKIALRNKLIEFTNDFQEVSQIIDNPKKLIIGTLLKFDANAVYTKLYLQDELGRKFKVIIPLNDLNQNHFYEEIDRQEITNYRIKYPNHENNLISTYTIEELNPKVNSELIRYANISRSEILVKSHIFKLLRVLKLEDFIGKKFSIIDLPHMGLENWLKKRDSVVNSSWKNFLERFLNNKVNQSDTNHNFIFQSKFRNTDLDEDFVRIKNILTNEIFELPVQLFSVFKVALNIDKKTYTNKLLKSALIPGNFSNDTLNRETFNLVLEHIEKNPDEKLILNSLSNDLIEVEYLIGTYPE